jgi:hypothetical protein
MSLTIKRPRKWKSSITILAAKPTRDGSEPFHRNEFADALYLLGNIQPEKSKKRL